MEIQQVFKRYEKKYMLSPEQEEGFLKAIEGKMMMDEYGEHTICNIYFDNDGFDLIRASLNKPIYKEKLRLRTYGLPKDGDHMSFVEIKKKYKGVVYKRRIPMKISEAEDYLYRGIRPEKDSQILREIDWLLQRTGVEPKVFLAYRRRAFYGLQNKNFRMTLDRSITCSYDDVLLTSGKHLDESKDSPELVGTKILPEGYSLLEIKIPGIMPLWMSGILSQLKIYPVSFSKYGTYYSTTPELYRSIIEAGRRSLEETRTGSTELSEKSEKVPGEGNSKADRPTTEDVKTAGTEKKNTGIKFENGKSNGKKNGKKNGNKNGNKKRK